MRCRGGRAFDHGEPFRPSDNDYDWLGPGVYFWEANPRRGLDYARELSRLERGKDKVRSPAVVGAIIDLGLCLDLTTQTGIERVRRAHARLKQAHGAPLPRNSKDRLRRNLDCAVIRIVHQLRAEQGEPPFESVRGLFIEGKPLHPTSGFYAKTHVQICVCDPAAIKGVFRVADRYLD